MSNIKRLLELAGLKEYNTTIDFIELNKAVSDALSFCQEKRKMFSFEEIIEYVAKQYKINYNDLYKITKFYLKNPHTLKKSINSKKIQNESFNDLPPPIKGLEGPWKMKNGRIVYYDPKEGAYYDRSTDMYLDRNETLDLHFNNMDDEYKKFKEAMADPHGGSMITPYTNEPSERDLNDAWEYMQDYIDDYIDNDNEIKLALEDFKNNFYDEDDKKDIINDILSSGVAIVYNRLERDGMNFFDEDEIKEELYKKLINKFKIFKI